MSEENKQSPIIPPVNTTTNLDPITSLPVEAPPFKGTLLEKIDKIDGGFYGNRFNRPTVVPGNPYANEDVTWDVKDFSDIDRKLYENQSGWGQFGGFLMQAGVGEILGGTIEGFGSLLDMLDGSLMDDFGLDTGWNDQDYGILDEMSSSLTGLGKYLRSSAESVAPIYSKPTADKFRPGDGDWWAKNGVSVVSTLSLMIPGLAVTKGLGMAGKSKCSY